MKRALSLILSVLFLLTAMPLGMVSAATDAVIVGAVDKSTVAYGGTVTLSVSMENNPGLVCWAVDVGYDTSVLEMIEQIPGDAYNGIGTLAFGPMDKNNCNVLWYDFINPDVTNNGHLFSITFKVKEGAALGEYPITLTTIDPDNMLNAAFDAVPFNYESPVVTIVGCIHEYAATEKAPTCGAEGAIVYTCALCGDSYSESIPATGEHTYDNACDAICNGCDYIREVGDHAYDSDCDTACNECGATREAAAHLYKGVDAPACVLCGAVLDVSAPIVYVVSDNPQVVRGDKVTVAVAMQQNPGLVGWQFLLNYDAAVLAPVSVVAADTFAGVEFGPVENVPFSAIWLDALNGDNTANGALYYVTFEVKADAAFGTTVLSVALVDAESVFNNDLNAVSFAMAESGIKVLDHTHAYDGDCDTQCNECGYTREAGEHTYESAVTIAPTCGAEGVMTYTCSVCGASYTETIPATGEHAYEGTVTVAPTCAAEGVMTYTCSVCGHASYTEAIPATGEHAYEGTVTVAPTCGAEGVMTYTCSVCGGASYTEAIPATGEHIYDNDCDAECNDCGYIRETVPHLYKNADAPVCALCGVALDITAPIVYITSNNPYVVRGDKVTVAVSMQQNPGLIGWQLLLSYDAAVLTPVSVVAADTFADVEFGPVENVPFSAIWLDALNGNNASNGDLYYITFEVKADAAFGTTALALALADADSVFDNDLNAVAFAVAESGIKVLDHTHTYDNDCDAACNECGFIREVGEHIYDNACDADCNVCGAIREVGEHAYEAEITTAPTCGAEGVMTYTCSICGASYTEAIPATGEHIYDNDCDADCNVCGTIRKIVHLYENADAPVCALCGAALDITAPIVYITSNNPYVARGDKVTVAVSMQQNPGLVGWQLLLNYDAAVLIPVSVVAADTFANVEFGPVENVPFSAIWLDALNGNNASNGDLYYITFEVKADAAFGTTALALALADADSVFDNELNAVTFAVAESGIKVLDHTHTYDNDCDAECNECGFIRDVGEHTYESEITTAPTCGAEGVMTYTCSICGVSYTEAIPATGEHTYDSAITLEPTCGAEGVLTYTCSVCGHIYTEAIPATGEHTYDNACDADCNVCGAIREVGEHTYESAVTTEPTCVDEGVRTYTCSICGDSYTEAIPATGEHTYDAAITTAPTCGAEGVKTYTCSVCGDTYTEAIPATGEHAYESVVTTEPTCVDAGLMTYTCSVCGDSYTEIIPATGEHAYEAVVTAPTCVDKGYTTYTCSVCGDSYVADEVDALGHAYEGVVTTEPTCGAEGVMTYTCSVCGDTYTEAIPATGEHTYDGDYDADCNVCGAIREVTVILGDVNGDGKFNVRDIGLMQQYMNDDSTVMIMAAADVNCDGKINVRDIGLMQQVMNGWDVAFGPQGK